MWFSVELDSEIEEEFSNPILFQSSVVENDTNVAFPEWNEMFELCEVSECRFKSIWIKVFNENEIIGQLYLDPTEIDVDDTLRWYELEPGFFPVMDRPNR